MKFLHICCEGLMKLSVAGAPGTRRVVFDIGYKWNMKRNIWCSEEAVMENWLRYMTWISGCLLCNNDKWTWSRIHSTCSMELTEIDFTHKLFLIKFTKSWFWFENVSRQIANHLTYDRSQIIESISQQPQKWKWSRWDFPSRKSWTSDEIMTSFVSLSTFERDEILGPHLRWLLIKLSSFIAR